MKEHAFNSAPPGFTDVGNGALKDKANKSQVSLFPLEILECLSEPLEAGQKKGYERDNWMKGIDFRTSFEAAIRHLSLWQQGVDYDSELETKYNFKMKHINAALFHIANIALMTKRNRIELDNRGK